MPDNPTPDEKTRAQRDWGTLELEALNTLTDPTRYPTIWNVKDLGREIEENADPGAVIRPLICAGLVYETSDGYVFASPAAFHAVALVGHVC
jgi:hypothetical protein